MKTAIRRQINSRNRQAAKAEIANQLAPCDVQPTLLATDDVRFRLVLQTQIYENYGTHCCECESDESCTCSDHWKAKAGSEYQRDVGTANDVIETGSAGLEKIASEIRQKVERNDRFLQEYAIGWSLVPTNEETTEERELREMHEWGYLAPGAKTEAERQEYYEQRLARLREDI